MVLIGAEEEHAQQYDSVIGCPYTSVACDYRNPISVSYTHLRAHETDSYLVCRLLLEKKKYAVFCLKKKNSFFFFFFLMIRRQPRSTHCISSAASDVYKRQVSQRRLLWATPRQRFYGLWLIYRRKPWIQYVVPISHDDLNSKPPVTPSQCSASRLEAYHDLFGASVLSHSPSCGSDRHWCQHLSSSID